MLLPLLREAGVLAGRPYSSGLTVDGFETLRFGADPAAVLATSGSTEIDVTARYRGNGFARLLAKIAYGSFVAALGLPDRARVPVLPLILGQADDASHWLGSANFRLNIDDEKPLHSIGFRTVLNPKREEQHLIVVRVKLFAGSGATVYEVVVAAANDSEGGPPQT